MVCTNGGSAPSRLWPRLEQPGQVRRLGGAGWEAEAARSPDRIQARLCLLSPGSASDSLGPSELPPGLCIGLAPCQGPLTFPHGYVLLLRTAHVQPSVALGVSPASPAPGAPSKIPSINPSHSSLRNHRKATFLRAQSPSVTGHPPGHPGRLLEFAECAGK